MHFLVFAEILVNLNQSHQINTYHAFCHSRRKSHLITGLSFVVKISSSAKESKDRVKKSVDSILGLLGDSIEQVVNLIRSHLKY